MKKKYRHHLQRLILLLLIFIFSFSMTLNTHASCTQGADGGQCVEYVRNYFGGSYTLIPSLCQYNSDCGAYNAWGHWDLGFGSGDTPQNNSIMVLNKASYSSVGHVAVVNSQSKNSDGTYTLSIYESNWDRDELVDCDVNYTFYPSDSTVKRKGAGAYPVLGFIYSEESSSGSDDKPDLRVSELNVSKHGESSTNTLKVQQGEEFNVDVWISNKGDGDVDDKFYIRYLISSDSTFTKNDKAIAKDEIDDSIESGDKDHEGETIALEEVGTYYIGVWADYKDDIDEEDESNNFSDSDDEIAKIIVVPRNNKPKGYIDRASCDSIVGWASDSDTDSPITVHFYVDGPAGSGIFLLSVTADQYRSDVGSHGFSFSTPESLKDANIHYLYAYGIDSSDSSNNSLIGTASILCAKSTELGSPVYRFWAPSIGAHFYTISEDEKDNVINTWPDVWQYEGIAWYAYPSQIDGTSPVYRFYSATLGSHFYTISEEEKNYVINTWPDVWQFEGIAWYAYSSYISGTSPVYRFHNLTSGSHFYTISEEEKNYVINTWPDVWQYEGIVYYIQTDHLYTNAISHRVYSATSSVSTPPICAFSATPLEGKSPLSVQFTDESEGNIDSWEWDFGDGSTSTESNPVHIFSSDGNYSVTLTVTGEDGWQSLEKTEYITVESPNLRDVIKALQVLAGMNPAGIEVKENEKIDLKTVIYILQYIAGLKN